MKILLVNDKYLPEAGAVAKIIESTAQELRALEHEVCICTTSLEARAPFDCIERDGIRVFRISRTLHSERMRFWRTLISLRLAKAFRAILEVERPDIVHFHNVHQFLAYDLLRIAKASGAATCMTAHDVMSFHYGKLIECVDKETHLPGSSLDYHVSFLQQIRRFHTWYHPVRRGFIRFSLGFLDRLFAVSGALQDALAQNGVRGAVVLHNFLDPAAWTIPDPSMLETFVTQYGLRHRKVILWGGRISEHKGGLQLLDALQKMRESTPECLLLVIGAHTPFVDVMRERARELSLEDHVHFIGRLEGEALRAAYYTATVVATPSVCFDTFVLMNAEAMMCKKPVVSTCFGGAAEVVQEGVTGYIVNPFDVDQLAARLLACCDEVHGRRLGEAGYDRVMKLFTRDRHVSALVEHYQELRSSYEN